MIKILELFGGIGAPRKALVNLGTNHKSIDYVEILPHAVTAYNQIFCNDYEPQDIKTWNMNVDLLVHGSPCQDWSKNGLNNVNSGRSILYERTLEIVRCELNPRPRVVIWENVPNLISKRHICHFEHYITEMEKMGYINSFKILNSKDFGAAQNRERIFTVSILDGFKFIFPTGSSKKTIKDIIDEDVKMEDYKLSENEMKLFFYEDGDLYVKENNSRGKRIIHEYDSINVERPNSKTRRGRVGSQRFQTITTSPNQAVYHNGQLRRMTEREAWKAMGFSDDDFDNVNLKGIPKSAIYALAGNSIVVPVLEEIFFSLLNDGRLFKKKEKQVINNDK